jgi:hypothetical protein
MATEKRFEPSTESSTFLFHVKHSLFDVGWDVDRISAEEFLRSANI